ncbi:MAG: S-layer homology domain-containing protein [Bacillota bacterium]
MDSRYRFLFKVISILIIIAFILGILSTFFFADSGDMSSWAVEEVNAALAAGLVPEELQSDYKSPIMRNEYAALAMRLFGMAGFSVQVTNDKPFPDISGDFYENTILKAYNAGVVGGYPDGTFKPENKITRQEIATLIVNLVRSMYPAANLKPVKYYDFEDNTKLEDWARDDVNFCYENGIQRGVGGNMIDPQGYSTREQAIMLIYRLAAAWRLIDGLGDPTALDDIVFYIDEAIEFDVIEMTKDKLSLRSTENGYFITAVKNDGKLKIMVDTKKPDSSDMRVVVKELSYTTKYPNKLWSVFEDNLDMAVESGEMGFYELSEEKYIMNGYVRPNPDGVDSFILYFEEY